MHKNKPYLFTYIIAYKHNLDRLGNLRKVLEWLAGFSGIELIIVEQDNKPKLPAYSLKGFKYIFTESDKPFNKAWAFNVGVKYSTTPAIIFGDSDIIMDPNNMIESLKLLQQYEAVSPYDRVIDLERSEVNMTLPQMDQIQRPGRGETDVQKICLCGGIIMYRRDALERIGGFGSESFIGWGGEDDFASVLTKRFLNWYERPGKCYHIFHEKVKPNMRYYQANLNLLQKLSAMSNDDLMKFINSSRSRTGLKNKCADK